MKNTKEHLVPQARREGLLVQELPDEMLVYDQQRHKAHCLNQTAAFVWTHCDGKMTVAEMARLLGEEFDTEVEERVVWLALDQLGKARLLPERVTPPLGAAGASRRDVMRRVGLAAAIALPLVTSIVAPTATQAANCLHNNAACTGSAQCCSGLCTAGSCVGG